MDKIYPYAEILDDSTMVLFHFKTPEKHQLIYSQDIPARYSVSKDIFKTLLGEIRELFEELRAEHKNNNDQVWTNHTLTLESIRLRGWFTVSIQNLSTESNLGL